ncbi:MAG: hemerythrin domain-containing protein [Candidatus Acidiferrales bacterium]
MTWTKPEVSAPETASDTGGEAAARSSDLDGLIAEARTLLAHKDSPEPETFGDPLTFIRDDHARQLRMCNLLDAFTEKLELEPVMPLASALLEYLTGDLPLHTEDEERDLRPALERRCEPEDNLDDVLKQLTREHELNRDLVSFMIEDLEALAEGRALSNPVRLMMNVKEFSETQRQHVTWEDRVLLPLARQRLTAEDLAAIARNMAARREVSEAG